MYEIVLLVRAAITRAANYPCSPPYTHPAPAPQSVPLPIFAAGKIIRGDLIEILEAIVQSVGDADTIGSMAGQIMGAYLGEGKLPPNLVNALLSASEKNLISDVFRII